jgi:hypothetical protein
MGAWWHRERLDACKPLWARVIGAIPVVRAKSGGNTMATVRYRSFKKQLSDRPAAHDRFDEANLLRGKPVAPLAR